MNPQTCRGRASRPLVTALLLSVATLLTFSRAIGLPFLPDYDDQIYVLENQNVLQGLTLESVRWAFTTTYAAFWHPLTWLSHMFDVELFGLNPAGHHLSAVLLHLAGALTLFFVLRGLTGALGRSALVAALFAVHPLHVESVAWISERKDVLCALFWFLGIGAYIRYVRSPDWFRYAGVFAMYIAALMSKSMAVTFPFVLLLLDYWPLGRLRIATAEGLAPVHSFGSRHRVWLEKIPLLLLVPVAALLSYRAQAEFGALNAWGGFPLWSRAGNALLSYSSYLVQSIVPAGLAAVYPHPGLDVSLPKTLLSAAFLAFATAACLRFVRSRPYLASGWFWYLGTLVPVVGIVQAGQFARADRYTYVPLVGFFVAAVWWLGELCCRRNALLKYCGAAAAAAVLAYAALAWVQTGYWRDGVALWTHTVDVTGDNLHARMHLGVALLKRGELEPAAEQFREAIRINGNTYPAMYFLADILDETGKPEEAVLLRERARAIDTFFNPDPSELNPPADPNPGESRVPRR